MSADADRLKEIAARANAAQIGPWKFWSPGYDDAGQELWSLGNADEPINRPVADFAGYGDPTDEDKDFIAYARDDIPYLLALVQGMREREERLTEALRPLLDAAEQEVARKEFSDPDRGGAEFWASQKIDSEYQAPGVTRRIHLARAVLAARDVLASGPDTDST